jgi:uncharacterized protein
MTIEEIVFIFFLFSFFGWVFELFLEVLAGRGYVNRGFFYGPVVPIYAAGFFVGYSACNPLRWSPVLVFFVSAIACTILEYIAGWILEKALNMRAWDYDLHPFTFWCNYKRRIALTASIMFGLFTVIVVYFLWEYLLNISRVAGLTTIRILDALFILIFLTDAFFSFRKYIRNKKAGGFNTTNGLDYHDEEERIFFDRIAHDIVTNEKFQECRNFIQHGRTTVYDHSLSVAKISFKLSSFWKVKDRAALVRAALLHDFFLYDWHDEWKLDHGFTHPVEAAENAVTWFNISEKEYSLIRTHMWPFTLLHPPQYKEGWIICAADKISSLTETLRLPSPGDKHDRG